MNKRGFTFFSDAINIILIILILIFFSLTMYFIDAKSRETYEQKVGELSLDARALEDSYVLLNYLRTPLTNNTEYELKIPYISNLIRLYKDDSSLESYLDIENAATLGITYGSCYALYYFGENIDYIYDNFACIDFPVKDNESYNLCLSIEEYNIKLNEGDVEECFV